MATYSDTGTTTFPDGSTVEWTLQTPDSTVGRIVTTTLSKRLRRAQTLFPITESGPSMRHYTSFAPGDQSDAHESTRTYALPDGELSVRIDASGKRAHGYLHYLVKETVAYVRVLEVDVPKAAVIATVLVGSGLVLVALGQFVLALVGVAPGAVIALYAAIYYLAARGVSVGVFEPRPLPTDRRR